MENLQKEPSGSPTNAQAALKKNTRVIAFWFFALVAGGFLGWLQIGWLNELFGFIATVFTRLFKFVAVPVIALAVITTLSQLGAKRETKQIFAHAIFYTLATTFAAALVALGLFILIAPENVPAAISAGCWTWSMSAPGSPSIQNVIAIKSLGTLSTAAFVPSLIVSIIKFLLIFVWLEYRARKFTKNGYYFDDARLKTQLSAEDLNIQGREDLPHWVIAFIPIILILVLFNGFHLDVVPSVFAGVALAAILMFKFVKGGIEQWVKVFNKGAADSGVAILNTAIVVGFGGVVKNTQGFADLVTALKGMSMPPLVFVMITVAICAGACGSASGGMGVAFNALTDTYLALGAKLPYIHRIATIAAGTLDTLPHQGAQITLLGICKLTHKEAYFDIAITQIIIPFITCGIFILLAQMGL